MIGYAATIAMRIIDGATISFARRRSGIPLERRRCVGAPTVWTEAASIVLSSLGSEGRQGAVDLRVRLLQSVRRARATGERIVDVLVDRLRDLRVDGRHRPGLGLAECLQELRRVRDGLLDVGFAVRTGDHRGLRE